MISINILISIYFLDYLVVYFLIYLLVSIR